MRTTIRDSATLRSVRPLELITYLRARKWTRAETIVHGAFWQYEDQGKSYEILLPDDQTVRDYSYRIADALATLQEAEARSQLEILEDIATTSADVVRPRLRGADHTGEISVEQGVIVHEQARNMLLAAACAAIEKRSLYAKRKPAQAMQFLEHARFGIPRQGSYVLTILSPVSPELTIQGALFGEENAPEPFERRTIRILAEALGTLESATREAAATGDLEPMQRSVARGVSANLCEAIIGLHEGSGENGVEFLFSWAPLRRVPASVPRVAVISPDAITIIRETARLFRETEPTHDTEVFGIVNRLEHQGGENGKVTIVGTADGVSRNVIAELAGPEHAMAVRSYQDRIPFSCVGELVREGYSWILRNPREIALHVTNEAADK